MARSLQLTVSIQGTATSSCRVAYAISAATDVDAAVFVMKRRVLDPRTGAAEDLYDHIATPEELQSLNVNAPPQNQGDFRLSSFSTWYSSRTLALQAADIVRNGLQRLLTELNAGDQAETQTYTITGA